MEEKNEDLVCVCVCMYVVSTNSCVSKMPKENVSQHERKKSKLTRASSEQVGGVQDACK